jgi:hypothetical protein
MNEKTHGQCPHCTGLAPLSPDGLTMYHADRNTMQGDCLGSRREPVGSEEDHDEQMGDSDGPTWSDHGGWVN